MFTEGEADVTAQAEVRGPRVGALRTLGEMALATFVAVLVAAVGLTAFSLVQWPAFNASNVTRALTTVGQVVALAALGLSVWWHRHGRSRFAKPLSWAGLSAFVTVTLGMPLAATKLYLFGMSVDQEFRTEYLTRLTDSPALRDMTYADTPPFYPAGWFWIGGRVANVLGLDGWEAFKPYAIGSLAVAAVLALVLWDKLIRSDRAIAVTTATTAVILAHGSPEPYGAIIALLTPPALVLAWGALHRPEGESAAASVRSQTPATTSGDAASVEPQSPAGGSSAAASDGPTASGARAPKALRGLTFGAGAVLGTGMFLGVAACFYTLYLGLAAFAVTLLAIVAAWLSRSVAPLVKLAIIAAISGAVALLVWLPFLRSVARQGMSGSGTATHYLPTSGAELPLPMLEFSLLGALTMLGTIWLVVRVRSSRRAQALTTGVVAIYLWSLASMLFTAAGNTLLSFRLEPVLLVLLTAAGVFAVVEVAAALDDLKIAAVVVASLGAIAFAQGIPVVLTPEINTAYTDTGCDGVRADKRPPGAAAHYREIDAVLRAWQQSGAWPYHEVVLTADTTFLACYPYPGFQAATSHYANPLADYAGRAAEIKRWSETTSAADFEAAMDKSPYGRPDAILFRNSPDGYTLRLAEDVYPNDPNVRRYTVRFDKALLEGWQTTEIGPFVLAIRQDTPLR